MQFEEKGGAREGSFEFGASAEVLGGQRGEHPGWRGDPLPSPPPPADSASSVQGLSPGLLGAS